MLKRFPVSGIRPRKLSGLRLAGSTPLVLPLLLLILTLAVGCSRPSDLPTDEAANKADQHKLPFQDNATKGNEGSNSGGGNSGNSGEAKPDAASNGDSENGERAALSNIGFCPGLAAGDAAHGSGGSADFQ